VAIVHPKNHSGGSNWSRDRIIELALVGVLAGVGVFQVCIYWRQADIMDKQANIAVTQNHIVETSGRAFINVDLTKDPTQLLVANSGQRVPGYEFQPVIENSGTTPTSGLTFFGHTSTCGTNANQWQSAVGDNATLGINPMQAAALSTTDDNKCPDFAAPVDPEDASKEYTPGTAFLGPHAKTQVGGLGISPELLRYVNHSGGRWYLSGVIHYRDIFPDSTDHVTKYCYVLGFELNTDGSLKPRAALCAHWNCADDECKIDRNAYEKEMASKPKSEAPQVVR
jgi:hypothetical protein